MKMKCLLVLVSISFLIAGCASSKQAAIANADSLVQSSNGTILHVPSNTFFINNVFDFVIVNKNVFDDSGENISVTYSLKNPVQIILTAFVYPAVNPQNHFEEGISQILTLYHNAKLIRQGDAPVTVVRGKYALFSITDKFYGTEQELYSFYYLFETRGWFVKFRITFLLKDYDAAIPRIDSYFQLFMFPGKERQ
jgi:hypothetical protein